MVYCGKPSKGCSHCRERKIRCDQREPACGQCEKRQRQCPGYRNMVDLMFRDESSHVIKKATAKARKRSDTFSDKFAHPPSKAAHQSTSNSSRTRAYSYASTTTSKSSRKGRPRAYSSSSSSTDSASDSPPSRYITTFQLCPAPKAEVATPRHVTQEAQTPSIAVLPSPLPCRYSPSFEDRGLNLFIARYVNIPANSCQNKFDFVFDFWTPGTSSAGRANDPVLASLSAVGLLGIAQMTSTQSFLNAARKSYGQALRLTNAALRDPAAAVKDTTMLSVLVLGIYESMDDHPGRRSMAAWQQHINGAAALAKTRGPSQFRTRAGARMFMLQVTNTMISCIQNELPMPKDLIDLREQLIQLLGGAKSVPGYAILLPIFDILQLKYDIKQGTVTDLDEMLAKFKEAEQGFDRAVSHFPDDWQYQKYRLTDRPRPGFFAATCDVYQNIHVATIWNGMRTCRMLILETLCEELHRQFSTMPVVSVPLRHQLEYQKAKSKLKSIGLAILDSVPQHFGAVHPSDRSPDMLEEISSPDESPTPASDWEGMLGDGETLELGDVEDEECCHHPSLSNPLQGQCPEAQAERYMLLASSTNGLVWPLYLVGLSTASSAKMRAFVVERLHAVYEESGVPQARHLADIVAKHMRLTTVSRRRPKPVLVNSGCEQVRLETQASSSGNGTQGIIP